jgi:hypothetical protein
MAMGAEQPAFFAHFPPPYGSSNKNGTFAAGFITAKA